MKLIREAIQMTKANLTSHENWPDWLHEAWQKDFTEAGALFSSKCIDPLTETEAIFLRAKRVKSDDTIRKIKENEYIVKTTYDNLFICSVEEFNTWYEKAE